MRITAREWRAAIAYVEAESPQTWALAREYAHQLAPCEREHLARHRRVHMPVQLASRLLRRIGVFRDVWWLKITSKGLAHLLVEWPENPSQVDAMAALCDPIVAIATDEYTVSTSPTRDFSLLVDHDGARYATHRGEAKGVELALRGLTSLTYDTYVA